MMLGDAFERALHGARVGDEAAVRCLHAWLHPDLVRFVSAYEPDVAAELAGDVWLCVALGIHGFDGGEHGFRAWVFTIARRRLRELRASDSLRRAFADEAGERRGSSREDDAGPPGHVSALGPIAQLPALERDVIALRVLADLSIEDVATVLQMRPAAALDAERGGLARLAGALDRRAVTA